jgi:hypothetical protein
MYHYILQANYIQYFNNIHIWAVQWKFSFKARAMWRRVFRGQTNSKWKFNNRIDHEDPDGERMYASTFSLTSEVFGVLVIKATPWSP